MCSDCKTGFNMFLLLFNCCLYLALKFLPDWSSFMKVYQNLLKIQNIKKQFFFILWISIRFKINTVFPHIVSAETILFWVRPYVLWPLITVHKCAETIQGRKLYEEIRYLKKKTGRQHIVEATFNFLLIEVKFSFFSKNHNIWS